MTKRYLILGDVDDDNAIQASFSLIGQLSKSCSEFILCVSSHYQLDSHTTLGRNIGGEAIASFKKGQGVVVGHGVMLSKTLPAIKKYSLDNAAVLAMFADQDMLDILDAKKPETILALPCEHGGVDDWVKTWNPEVLKVSRDANNHLSIERIESQSMVLISDAIVVKALRSLTNRIHTKSFTDFNHSEDKKFAKKCFGVLRKKKHEFDPKLIRSWVIQEGFTPKLADRIEIIAQRINDLKNNPTIHRADVNRLYEYFKTDSELDI